MGKLGTILGKAGTTILVGAGTFAAKKAGELAADRIKRRFSPEEETMVCPTCSATGQVGAFCSNCGNSLAGPAVPAPAPIVPAPIPAPAPRPAPTPPPAPAPVPTPAGPNIQLLPDGSSYTSLPNGAVIYTDPHGNKFSVRSDGSLTPLVPPTPPAPVPTPGHTPAVPHKKGWLANIKQRLDNLDEATGFKKSH